MDRHSCKFSQFSLKILQEFTYRHTAHFIHCFSLTVLQNILTSYKKLLKELSFYVHLGCVTATSAPPSRCIYLCSSVTGSLAGFIPGEVLHAYLWARNPFISIPFHIARSLSEVSWYGLCNGDQGGSRTVVFPWEAICTVAPVAETTGWVPCGRCPVLYHSVLCQPSRVIHVPCPRPTKEWEHPCSPDFWLLSEDMPLHQSACL